MPPTAKRYVAHHDFQLCMHTLLCRMWRPLLMDLGFILRSNRVDDDLLEVPDWWEVAR